MRPGLSCIVDSHPRFLCEFILWLICANAWMPGPKRAYFVNAPPKDLVKFAKRNDCDIRMSDPLIPDSPHCNKMLPFLDPDGFEEQIVTDTDVFLTADLTPLFHTDHVRLAPNNHASPPLGVFANIFEAAGFTTAPEVGLALFPGKNGRETYAGNVSAGVIAIPSGLRDFVQHWHKRALWLLDHADLLGKYRVHIDQVSFAVAAHEQNLPFEFLPAQANAILQLLGEIDTLYALHLTTGHIPKFPEFFTPEGHMRSDQINPKLTEQLTAFNAHVSEAMSEIEAMPGLAAFRPYFLSPTYQRSVHWPTAESYWRLRRVEAMARRVPGALAVRALFKGKEKS